MNKIILDVVDDKFVGRVVGFYMKNSKDFYRLLELQVTPDGEINIVKTSAGMFLSEVNQKSVSNTTIHNSQKGRET